MSSKVYFEYDKKNIKSISHMNPTFVKTGYNKSLYSTTIWKKEDEAITGPPVMIRHQIGNKCNVFGKVHTIKEIGFEERSGKWEAKYIFDSNGYAFEDQIT